MWAQVRRGLHTSGVIWFYFLLAVICGAPTLHGNIHWHRPHLYEWILFCSQYAITISLFIVCSFADRLPQTDKCDPSREKCPKETVSFPSRLFFSWFTSMAINGWRRPLTLSDLWQIREPDKSSVNHSSFDKHWKSKTERTERSSIQLSQTNISLLGNGHQSVAFKVNGSLSVNGSTDCIKRQLSHSSVKSGRAARKKMPGVMWTIAKTFWFYFFTGAIFKLLSDILTFINPQVMK